MVHQQIEGAYARVIDAILRSSKCMTKDRCDPLKQTEELICLKASTQYEVVPRISSSLIDNTQRTKPQEKGYVKSEQPPGHVVSTKKMLSIV